MHFNTPTPPPLAPLSRYSSAGRSSSLTWAPCCVESHVLALGLGDSQKSYQGQEETPNSDDPLQAWHSRRIMLHPISILTAQIECIGKVFKCRAYSLNIGNWLPSFAFSLAGVSYSSHKPAGKQGSGESNMEASSNITMSVSIQVSCLRHCC